MKQYLQVSTASSLCAKATLLFLATLLMAGCATSTQYPTSVKIVNVQDVPMESDPANKVSNLSYDQLIQKADTYLNSNNIRLAQLHYRKALDKKPLSMAANIGLATILFREAKLEEAAQLLKNALEDRPSDAPALTLLGSIERNRGNLNDSLSTLNKALELSPQDPEVLTELAITNDCIGQERLTYAEPLYKKVVTLKPNSSAAHNNLGFNYLLQGRHQDAIMAFTRALTLAPNNVRANNNLAVAYLLDQQTDRALKLFEDTVGQAAAYNNLGYIQMTRGNWREAKQAFKTALQLNPSFYVRAQQNMESLSLLSSNTP